jgi:hypothetical protein
MTKVPPWRERLSQGMIFFPVGASDPPAGFELDWNSSEVIEIEKAITFTYGKKFRERGPPAPKDGGPELWRNQVWRESAQRWGNRGGKNREAWAAKFGGKSAKASGQSKGKDEGKGSSKGKFGDYKGDGKGDSSSGGSSSSASRPT